MRVLVASRIADEAVRRLREAGLEVDLRPEITQSVMDEVYAEYDAVIVRSNVRVRPVRGAGRLRLVVRAGAGVDNIDVEGFSKLGVEVRNTPGAVAEAVAELTIGLMLCLARGIPRLSSALREGAWLKGEGLGGELRGKTLGVVGCGRIGSRVARIARALGMEILISDIVKIPDQLLEELAARQVELDHLLRESDIVSVHVPLTAESRRLIGERELRLMKPSSYIVNTSRGGVVDESALKKALREGWISGAALDVFEEEPPSDRELLSLPNLVATPHIGAQTREAQLNAGVEAAEIVISSLARARSA